MTPYYEQDGITIYHGDCREIAPTIEYGAVVSDPPYGMKANTDSRRFSGGKYGTTYRAKEIARGLGPGRAHNPVAGDAEPFDPGPWLDREWVVLFGANHYAERLPVGTTLVWLKRADEHFGTFLSDAELAWRKGGHGVYCYRKQFPPPARMAELSRTDCPHPTQKPLGLMKWAILKSGAPDNAVILDPYAGTGTTLRAAKDLGRKAIGIEIEERYCEIAANRLAQQVFDMEPEA